MMTITTTCCCGEVELGSTPDDLAVPPLEIAGTIHRSDGPCYQSRATAAADEHGLARCDTCHRITWAPSEVGRRCRMTQPDGSSCSGRFIAGLVAADRPERITMTYGEGSPAQQIARILGLGSHRLTRNFALHIPAGGNAVAQLELFLTPAELRDITAVLAPTSQLPDPADVVRTNTP